MPELLYRGSPRMQEERNYYRYASELKLGTNNRKASQDAGRLGNYIELVGEIKPGN